MKLGVAYLGSYLPKHIRSDLTDIKDIGCDEVLVTLDESDFHIFPGKVKATPEIGHDLGLRVMANFWGFACGFGGGCYSHLADIWIVNRDGSRVGNGCMNNSRLLGRERGMVDDCVSAGYDAFFWDEPTKQDCYCKFCQQEYEKVFYGNLLTASTDQVKAFRLYSMAHYVETMSNYVKSLKSDIETATCVMPVDREAWEDTARISSLDTFGTDPYWICDHQPVSWVSEPIRSAIDLCLKYNKRSLMWLQGWVIPAGREDEIEQAARLIVNENPDALYVWSYMAGLGSSEASDDTGRAWQVIADFYRMIKDSITKG